MTILDRCLGKPTLSTQVREELLQLAMKWLSRFAGVDPIQKAEPLLCHEQEIEFSASAGLLRTPAIRFILNPLFGSRRKLADLKLLNAVETDILCYAQQQTIQAL